MEYSVDDWFTYQYGKTASEYDYDTHCKLTEYWNNEMASNRCEWYGIEVKTFYYE